MTRYGIALFAGAAVFLLAGCSTVGPEATPAPDASADSTSTAGATTPVISPTASGPAAPGPPTASGAPPTSVRPGEDPHTFRTSYRWGVPVEPVRVSHVVRPPVAPPPAAPLPHLVEIHAADQPDQRPAYSRISFYFRGGFPSYELGYVPRLTAEGTGATVPLPGNAVLRVRFVEAQAHDERGRWTVTESPRPQLGFPTMRGYALGGDFEGNLSYGLGLRVAPGSDQVLPIRVVEVSRTGGLSVIAFDVQHD